MRRPEFAWVLVFVRRYLPWVAIDLPLVWLCYLLAMVVRGTTADLDYWPAVSFAVLASAIVVASNEAFGIYRRWWRYATAQDVMPIAMSVASATVAIVGADLYWPGARPMPLSAVLLGSFFAFAAMTAVRYRSKPIDAVRRTWRRLMTAPSLDTKKVLIVGAGEAGANLAWQVRGGQLAETHAVVGFVDDDPLKRGALIHGVPVLGDRRAIPEVAESNQVDLIVIAINSIAGRDFREIVELCQETDAQIKVLPNIYESLNPAADGLSPSAMFGDVTVEDLLGRHTVRIDRDQCRHLIQGKVVLVTGASGSIGSELCRQLATLSPTRLVMLDANESGLHDLSVELGSAHTRLVPTLADVTNERRVRELFAQQRPNVVFHAAAYKHVPLVEQYPEEGVRVNIGGTLSMMRLSAEFGVERFVLVSSDKAVEPSSAMGATKHVCEMLARAMPPSSTLFTAVRFGNVLASRGSVVPTFTRQIDAGGPVTVTDPRMQRYFMSLSEAASLIIQAANFTRGGDLFLLDMGEEINIGELARKMIRLRGLRPDVDVPIEFTGVRPGEKLREALTAADEATADTDHPQVLRVESGNGKLGSAELLERVDELLAAARDGDRAVVESRLWALAGPRAREVVEAPARVPVESGTRPTSAPVQAVPMAAISAGDGAAAAVVRMPEAPLPAMARRFSTAITALADTLLRFEPAYALPAVAVLFLYPNPLVGTALAAIVLPWLIRWARFGTPGAATPFDIPLGLFVAGAIVGLLVTTDERWAGIRISGLIGAVAAYYVIVNHATTHKRLRAAWATTMICAIIASGLLLALSAPYLGTEIGGWINTWLGSTGETLRQTVLAAEDSAQRYRFRAAGLGALATFGLALTLGPMVASNRQSYRLIALSMGGLCVTFVAISGNRAAQVGVPALLVALLGLRSGWLLAIVPPVLAVFWVLLERGWLGPAAADSVPIAIKMQLWQNASIMLHDFAITGTGLGLRSPLDVYESYFLRVGPGFQHAHNSFIQAYLEQGLPGAVGLVGIATFLFVQGRKAVTQCRDAVTRGVALSGAAAATVLFFSGLTEVVLLTTLGTLMLMVALGLLVASARTASAVPTAKSVMAALPSWGHVLSAMPFMPLFIVLLATALLITPLGSSLFLNLGAAERVRAQLHEGLPEVDKQARLARARGLLDYGLSIDDRDPAIWRNIAETSLVAGARDEARGALAEAHRRTSNNDGPGLFQLGRLYRDAGQWPEAIRTWREARAGDALFAWGVELRTAGHLDLAFEALNAAAELKGDSAEVYARLTEVSAATQGPDGTLRTLRRLTQIVPNSPWPWVELARTYADMGRGNEAAEARTQAARRGGTEGSR